MSLKLINIYEIDFLHADQHQTFLPVDTINLVRRGQACTNYTKLGQ